METEEKTVAYPATNTYLTLNKITAATTHVWIVFHGIGYLSRYFISHFRSLDPATNYIIAPQAPSKYYLDKDYRHVGASWLTRENTGPEITNVLNYVQAAYLAEEIPAHCRLIVLGFSQGVSVAVRWVARSHIPCSTLVLYAGGIPEDVRASEVSYLSGGECRIALVAGDADPILTPKRMETERKKANALFGKSPEFHSFSGGHEINPGILARFIV